MTITVSSLGSYEKGKKYLMNVLFVDPKNAAFINVLDFKTGRSFKVEVLTPTAEPLMELKDKQVVLVCMEVTPAGPEFELDAKYFTKAMKPKRGSRLTVKEGKTVEFKRSLLFSPVNSQLSNDQPFEIAKQIAAFMNTEGGDLYVGVDDEGYVTGIEGDLPHLEELKIVVGSQTDEKWSYGHSPDGFKRKLTSAIVFYLGAAAQGLVDAFEEFIDEASGLTYYKIHVNPSEDDIVYIGRADDVYMRAEASVICLCGRQRDQYIKRRFVLRGEKSATEALAEFKKENESLEKKVAQKEKELAAAIAKGSEKALEQVVSINGMKYQVEKDTCLPLDEKFLVAMEKPFGLVYKAGAGSSQRFMPCGAKKTWQALYEQLLNLCSELDPAKFAALPDNEDFEPKRHCAKTKPNFVRRKDRVRLQSGSGYLGKDGDIRANLQCASKTAFLNETSLPRRLMAHFGIEVKDIRIWNGK